MVLALDRCVFKWIALLDILALAMIAYVFGGLLAAFAVEIAIGGVVFLYRRRAQAFRFMASLQTILRPDAHVRGSLRLATVALAVPYVLAMRILAVHSPGGADPVAMGLLNEVDFYGFCFFLVLFAASTIISWFV